VIADAVEEGRLIASKRNEATMERSAAEQAEVAAQQEQARAAAAAAAAEREARIAADPRAVVGSHAEAGMPESDGEPTVAAPAADDAPATPADSGTVGADEPTGA
jgi:small subunit ribosomal protein S2